MTSSNGSVEASAASTAAAYHGYDSGHSTSHSPNDDALIAASGKAAVISREAADKLGELECTQYGLYGTGRDMKANIRGVIHKKKKLLEKIIEKFIEMYFCYQTCPNFLIS